MKRAALLALLSTLVLGGAAVSIRGTASAAEPIVVVKPPAPSGPIPIPYPNTNPTASPRSQTAALAGFLRAELASGGIISVLQDNGGPIE